MLGIGTGYSYSRFPTLQSSQKNDSRCSLEDEECSDDDTQTMGREDTDTDLPLSGKPVSHFQSSDSTKKHNQTRHVTKAVVKHNLTVIKTELAKQSGNTSLQIRLKCRRSLDTIQSLLTRLDKSNSNFIDSDIQKHIPRVLGQLHDDLLSYGEPGFDDVLTEIEKAIKSVKFRTLSIKTGDSIYIGSGSASSSNFAITASRSKDSISIAQTTAIISPDSATPTLSPESAAMDLRNGVASISDGSYSSLSSVDTSEILPPEASTDTLAENMLGSGEQIEVPVSQNKRIRKSDFLAELLERSDRHELFWTLQARLGDENIISNLIAFLKSTNEEFLTVAQLSRIASDMAFFTASVRDQPWFNNTSRDKWLTAVQEIIQKFHEVLSPLMVKESLLENLQLIYGSLLDPANPDKSSISRIENMLATVKNAEGSLDKATWARISLALEDFVIILNQSQDDLDTNRLGIVNTSILAIQQISRQDWKISTISVQPDLAPLPDGISRKCQSMLDLLRLMHEVTKHFPIHECNFYISELLVDVIAFGEQPTPEKLDQIEDSLDTLLADLNIRMQGDDSLDLRFVKSNALVLKSGFDELVNDINAGTTTAPDRSIDVLRKMFSAIQPVLADTDESNHGEKIISNLLSLLAEKEELDRDLCEQICDQVEKLSANLNAEKRRRCADGTPMMFIKANVNHLRQVCRDLLAEFPEDTGVMELRSKRGFLKMLREIYFVANQSDLDMQINQRIFSLILHLRNLAIYPGEPTIHEWANISLKLEGILADISSNQQKYAREALSKKIKTEEVQPEKIHPEEVRREEMRRETLRREEARLQAVQHEASKRLAYIKKGIEHLEFVSRFAWAELARESIVDELEPYYGNIWFNPAYSNFTTTELSAGVLVGTPSAPAVNGVNLSAGIGASVRNGSVVDDEGYLGKMNQQGGSVAAGAEFGAGGASGKATYTWGKYKEWNSPRHLILATFDGIIEKYSSFRIRKIGQMGRSIVMNVPDIEDCPKIDVTHHFSRSATLGLAAAKKNEIIGFDELRDTYDSQIKNISQFFSVLQSRGKERSTSLLKTVPRTVTAKSTAAPVDSIIDAEATTTTAAFSGHLGLKVLGADASIGLGERANLAPSVNVDFTPLQTVALEIPRYNWICKTLDESSDAFKENAAKEIAKKNKGLIKKFITENDKITRKSTETRSGRIEALILQDYRLIDEDIAEKDANGNITYRAYVNYVEGIRKSKYSHIQALAIAQTQEKYRMLKQDFECYEKLQAQLKYGDATTRASIDAFHERYGARNSKTAYLFSKKDIREDCMVRMLALTAYLYTELMDLPELADGPAQLTELRTNLMELEKSIREPAFVCNRKEIEKRVCYKQSFILKTDDVRFTLSLKGLLGFISTSAVNLMSSISASVMCRLREHPNIFRDGDYIDLTLHFGQLLEHDALSSVLELTLKALRNDPKTQPVAPGFCDALTEIQNNYTAYATGLPIDRSKGGDLTWRFYNPSKFKTGYQLWHTSITAINDRMTSGKAPLPIIPGVSLTVGLSRERTTTSTKAIWYSPRTVLHFATRYVHEHAAGNGDADGNLVKMNYWDKHIKKEQEPTIKQLFRNVALELAQVRSGRPLREGGLLQQMAEINKVLGAEAADDRLALEARTKSFIAAVEIYANSTVLTEQAKYQDALKKFEAMFFEYHPHVQRHKAVYPRTPNELILETSTD